VKTRKTTRKRAKTRKVFVISDTHFPFHSKSGYRKMLEALEKEQPDVVVQIGDLLDQYVFSKYTRSPNISLEQDLVKGLAKAQQMWATIQHLVPGVECYQLLGNHDVRMAKRIAEKLPELGDLISTSDIYAFENVTLLPSDREYLLLDGVVYTHGHLSKSIDHAKHFNKPTVHGHRHRPTIEFDSAKLWSMDVGYMADSKSLPLSYTQTRLSKWTMACGVVENGKPRLIILE
jgi:predicted phosphodiesterase